SNTGHSVTLTCDRIEDYVNCAYRQVKIDGTVILEESIPRATYTTVNVSHAQICDDDGDCTEITTCNLFIVGRNGSRPIPFETFNQSDYNCTQETQLVGEITRLIQGESKVSVFRVQDVGLGDLWPIAWDFGRNVWLGFFLLMGLTNFRVKQDIWTFDRKKQCLSSERKRLWGSKIEEIALDDLTGIYGAYPDIALSIKEGDNLQAKTISSPFPLQYKYQFEPIFELIIPWLNPHCRVLKTRNYSLEITPNQLRFLEGKVVKFLLIKDIGCFKLSDNSLEGKTQDIQAIVIRQKPPDSDGDIFKQLCIQTIAGKIHPFSPYSFFDCLQTIAQTIADYIGVEVTIEEVSS
ncbi:MAG: hypothetical protein ACOYME_02335, partial [Prochlorotrichaceae cyanobacterium]